MRAALLGFVVALFTTAVGCDSSDGRATARIITHRSQLIGGHRAAGELGDVLIENEKVRFIVHKAGLSRGFGVYGGSIIDADLRRPHEQPDGGDGQGFDNFSEMFPAFFLQAVAVDEVNIISDGSDGGAAIVEAAGSGGDFFEFLGVFNRLMTGSNETFDQPESDSRVRYAIRYILDPGAQYLTIRFNVTNISDKALTFPSSAAVLLEQVGLPLEGFSVPIGDVALFGATAKPFVPGVGFDLRFGLEDAYNSGISWPAFPGILAPFVASRGEHTSYGLLAEPSPDNFIISQSSFYEDLGVEITDTTMLIPFITGGAFGIFYGTAPDELAPGASFEVGKKLIVGRGDVGSIVDVIHEIQGTETGKFGALVVDQSTGAHAADASVIVYERRADGSRSPYSQYDVQPDGHISGTLPVGDFSALVTGEGRPSSPLTDFSVTAGETTPLRIESPSPGRIVVNVQGVNGLPLPAKASAVGRYGPEHTNQLTPTFLFDLKVGEHFRFTDLESDSAEDADTRRYVENIAFTDRGVAELVVRPGTYEVVTSRGPEYNIRSTTVTVGPHGTANVAHTLERVVDTTGWISADAHVHSVASTDSGMKLDERVRSLAAEGIEVPIATDHNVVTDYGPAVAEHELTHWMHPVVGVELTTLESGHFNGYPLEYNPALSTHGSFEWAQQPPDEVFRRIRELGNNGADQTLVQVNHPRDQVLGYFSQYTRDPWDFEPVPPSGLFGQFTSPYGPAFVDSEGETTFSFDYDVLEVLNGKLYWQIHHFRVPEKLPPGELPDEIAPAGTILSDAEGGVGFPGVVDDWFNLLNLGHRYVAVGTGDSHSSADEAGQFRTMIFVGDDTPESITDQMLVDGLRSRRVVATNGPMIDFFINDPASGAMGKTIVDTDGTVSMTIKLTAAPWMSVARVNVYRNGQIAHAVDLSQSRDLTAAPFEETVELSLDQDGTAFKDSWFVVEALGYSNMFPVVRPLEIPPLLLIDAIGSLAGPLGFGQDAFGALRPAEVFPITPYAISNPVWVTRNAGGAFEAPGIVPIEQQSDPANDSQLMKGIEPVWTVPRLKRIVRNKSLSHERLDFAHGKVPLFYPLKGDLTDVRHALCRYGLPHGH